MQLIVNQDKIVGQFVAERVSGVRNYRDFGEFRAIGLARAGKLVAGVVLTAYTGFDVTLTIAADSPRWATRPFIEYVFALVFTEYKCVRVSAVVSKRNRVGRKFAEWLNFKIEGVRPYGYDGVADAINYGMLKAKCPWLNTRQWKRVDGKWVRKDGC